jgi:hypothetical protein
MSYLAIHVKSLCKRHRIGGRQPYLTTSGRLATGLKSTARWFNSGALAKSDPGARYIRVLPNVLFLPRRSGERRGPCYERG